MREKKFRGKRLDNGEWVEGYYVPMVGIHKTIHFIYTGQVDTGKPQFLQRFRVDPETVGQYTGLKDRNGKEIFEGDIVRHSDYTNGAYFSLSGDKDVQPKRNYKVDMNHLIENPYAWFRGMGDKSKKRIAEDTEVIGTIYDQEAK